MLTEKEKKNAQNNKAQEGGPQLSINLVQQIFFVHLFRNIRDIFLYQTRSCSHRGGQWPGAEGSEQIPCGDLQFRPRIRCVCGHFMDSTWQLGQSW